MKKRRVSEQGAKADGRRPVGDTGRHNPGRSSDTRTVADCRMAGCGYLHSGHSCVVHRRLHATNRVSVVQQAMGKPALT